MRKQTTLTNVQAHKSFGVCLIVPRSLKATRHMRPRRSWQIALMSLVLAFCCAAQRNFQLQPTETIPLEYNLQFWGAPQLQCDSDGNLYMLAHSVQDSSRDHLLRVSADAKETTQIDPRSVPELQGFRISPVFAPGRGGEFLLIASKTPSLPTQCIGPANRSLCLRTALADVLDHLDFGHRNQALINHLIQVRN